MLFRQSIHLNTGVVLIAFECQFTREFFHRLTVTVNNAMWMIPSWLHMYLKRRRPRLTYIRVYFCGTDPNTYCLYVYFPRVIEKFQYKKPIRF